MWLKKNLNLLVIIGACIIVFTFFNKKEDYVEEYNAKIEALEGVDAFILLNMKLSLAT